MLGIVDFDHQIAPGRGDDSERFAKEVLEHRCSAWRANRNAALLVAAGGPTLTKARATARTLAALLDLKDDRHRLGRFNNEQREQLDKRLSNAEQRLPQQVVMSYRHLLVLGEGDAGGARLDHIDLGPAGANTTITDRVLDYLRGADRLVETTLAPAALLAARFGLLPEGTDAVELDAPLGYSTGSHGCRSWPAPTCCEPALAEGVTKGLFGLSSGSTWDASDAVVRFAEVQDPSEIEFQPGTWLVRASAARSLKALHGLPIVSESPPAPAPDRSSPAEASPSAHPGGEPVAPASATLPSLRLTVRGVPASKARDLVKVAVIPLAAASSDVELEVTIRADGGIAGIPKETLNLVVLEGLRQLGLSDVTLE